MADINKLKEERSILEAKEIEARKDIESIFGEYKRLSKIHLDSCYELVKNDLEMRYLDHDTFNPGDTLYRARRSFYGIAKRSMGLPIDGSTIRVMFQKYEFSGYSNNKYRSYDYSEPKDMDKTAKTRYLSLRSIKKDGRHGNTSACLSLREMEDFYKVHSGIGGVIHRIDGPAIETVSPPSVNSKYIYVVDGHIKFIYRGKNVDKINGLISDPEDAPLYLRHLDVELKKAADTVLEKGSLL